MSKDKTNLLNKKDDKSGGWPPIIKIPDDATLKNATPHSDSDHSGVRVAWSTELPQTKCQEVS